jgi:hypothetical protein
MFHDKKHRQPRIYAVDRLYYFYILADYYNLSFIL